MIRYPTTYKKQKRTTSKEIANKISDHREFQIVIGIEEDEDVGTQLISMASSSSWALKDFPADHGHRVTVGREQPVLRAEREDRANLGRFLAVGRRIHGEPSLLGQGCRLGIETPGQHHLPVQCEENVVARHLEVDRRDSPAVGVQQRQRSPGGQQPVRLRAGGDNRYRRCHMRSDQGRQLVTILGLCSLNI